MSNCNRNLFQLASEVPGVINEVSKRRPTTQDPAHLNLEDIFDFPRFYGERAPGADPGSPGRSDTPELTSGSSGYDADTAPSPGPPVDSDALKSAVKHVKQQDDRFTVPEREIRPKGAWPYPPHIQLEKSTTSSGMSSSSSSASPRCQPIFTDSTTKESSSVRGRRKCPLEDPERTRRCDEEAPCSHCRKAAKNYRGHDDAALAEELCFRRLYLSDTLVFHRSNIPNQQHTGTNDYQKCVSSWNVFADKYALTWPLTISVVESWCQRPDNRQVVSEYTLDKNNSPQEGQLYSWVTNQIGEDDTVQSALDLFLAMYANANQPTLPQHDLVKPVHQMRCMYKIWRQEKLFFQRQGGAVVEVLPSSIHQSLRDIAKMRMKSLESDVLERFRKLSTKDNPERLPLWASMMQFILLYRDMLDPQGQLPMQHNEALVLQPKARELLNKLVTLCAVLFDKKKRPERMVEDGNPVRSSLNVSFGNVESRLVEFCTWHSTKSTMRIFGTDTPSR
ncbi:hypothetical protein GGR56DRAFT_43677 [Xylariaceae sp. FL0804]|nr:hypothetical protein GGR56DRAFT_43677 [Xylariaceae sp. FL0804]